jgi:ribosomal protein S18 acetylase RimI-like enzyme
MVGALLTEDLSTGLPQGMEHLSPKFDAIFDILGQLDGEFRRNRSAHPDESLQLFLLGVALRYAGQGIAQRLIARCLAHGASGHYRVAVTEATNTTSQHIFRKLGFVERVRRTCQDHRFNGRSYFAWIAEQGGPMPMKRGLARLLWTGRQ